jgi:hypothetical protein
MTLHAEESPTGSAKPQKGLGPVGACALTLLAYDTLLESIHLLYAFIYWRSYGPFLFRKLHPFPFLLPFRCLLQ